jgi:uncharacterized OB-fold protein
LRHLFRFPLIPKTIMDEEEELTECPRCGSKYNLMPSEGMCEECFNEECKIEAERKGEVLDTLRSMGN